MPMIGRERMSERGARITPAAVTPIAPVTTHRVCPHCHAQTDASGVSCPRCGQRYAVRKKWPWVVVAIALAMFVGFVGCITVVGPTIHLDTGPLSAQQAAHAISRDQFDAVRIGASRAEVIAQLGKQPQNAQAFEYKGLHSDRLAKRCIYYNRTDSFADDAYQFCFTNGALASKVPV
jgi:hypothetical protein